MNKILILGSTGSIGKSALEVIKGNDGYSIKSLVARNNKKLILEQAKEAVLAGADSVLLDELSPEILKKKRSRIKRFINEELKKRSQ